GTGPTSLSVGAGPVRRECPDHVEASRDRLDGVGSVGAAGDRRCVTGCPLCGHLATGQSARNTAWSLTVPNGRVIVARTTSCPGCGHSYAEEDQWKSSPGARWCSAAAPCCRWTSAAASSSAPTCSSSVSGS